MPSKLAVGSIAVLLACIAILVYRPAPTPDLAEMDRLADELTAAKAEIARAESEARTADSVLRLSQDVARRRVADARETAKRAIWAAQDSGVTADSLRQQVVVLSVAVSGLAQTVDTLVAHIDTMRQAVDAERVLRMTAQATADSAINTGRTIIAAQECRVGPLRCPSRGAVLGVGIALGLLIPLIR